MTKNDSIGDAVFLWRRAGSGSGPGAGLLHAVNNSLVKAYELIKSVSDFRRACFFDFSENSAIQKLNDFDAGPPDRGCSTGAVMTGSQAIGLAVVAASIFGICNAPRAEPRDNLPPVTDCDRLAAQPSDSLKVAEGVLMEQIDAARAIAACKRAVAAHPDTPRFHFQLGRALEATKSYNEALLEYRAAAERKYLRAMINVGLAYGEGKGTPRDGAKALEWFRKAADQGDPGAMSYIGWAHIAGWGVDKDVDLAISNCSETIQRAPKYAFAYECRGIAYAIKRDFNRAITDYNTVMQLSPKWGEPYLQRGIAYLNKREWDRAIADFNEAIRRHTVYANLYAYRGAAYEKLGRKIDAISDYRKALLLDPADKRAAEGLKRLGAKPF